ncbi:MAG TPA: hypothetical protein PK710_17175 [Polyangiaceae bacterium]|nr:hypothetical protein [Polyangiaceae bacterium]
MSLAPIFMSHASIPRAKAPILDNAKASLLSPCFRSCLRSIACETEAQPLSNPIAREPPTILRPSFKDKPYESDDSPPSEDSSSHDDVGDSFRCREPSAPVLEPCLPIASSEGQEQRQQWARVHTLEQWFPSIVRKAAWSISADRRSAILRLEIGTGAMRGAIVLIRADPHSVHVELDAPPGIDLEAWKNRLRRRLASHRLAMIVS